MCLRQSSKFLTSSATNLMHAVLATLAEFLGKLPRAQGYPRPARLAFYRLMSAQIPATHTSQIGYRHRTRRHRAGADQITATDTTMSDANPNQVHSAIETNDRCGLSLANAIAPAIHVARKEKSRTFAVVANRLLGGGKGDAAHLLIFFFGLPRDRSACWSLSLVAD